MFALFVNSVKKFINIINKGVNITAQCYIYTQAMTAWPGKQDALIKAIKMDSTQPSVLGLPITKSVCRVYLIDSWLTPPPGLSFL